MIIRCGARFTVFTFSRRTAVRVLQCSVHASRAIVDRAEAKSGGKSENVAFGLAACMLLLRKKGIYHLNKKPDYAAFV